MATETVGLFRSMSSMAGPELDIPIVRCPDCKKQRLMTIRTIVPRMRARNGFEVDYVCTVCGASEHKTVRPA